MRYYQDGVDFSEFLYTVISNRLYSNLYNRLSEGVTFSLRKVLESISRRNHYHVW